MKQRFLGLAVLSLIALTAFGCDMRGDPNLNDPNHPPGAGNPAQDATVFVCENNSTCFSGTQYCLKSYNGFGVLTGAHCVNYPNGGCQTRSCLLNDAKTQDRVNCGAWQEFHQEDSKITVICRTRQ